MSGFEVEGGGCSSDNDCPFGMMCTHADDRYSYKQCVVKSTINQTADVDVMDYGKEATHSGNQTNVKFSKIKQKDVCLNRYNTNPLR